MPAWLAKRATMARCVRRIVPAIAREICAIKMLMKQSARMDVRLDTMDRVARMRVRKTAWRRNVSVMAGDAWRVLRASREVCDVGKLSVFTKLVVVSINSYIFTFS